jgi:hypothetical protein
MRMNERSPFRPKKNFWKIINGISEEVTQSYTKEAQRDTVFRFSKPIRAAAKIR